MKHLLHKKLSPHGSVLMMTMIVTVIVGIVLASYLYLIRFQNISVVHSQSWNAALAVAEAGVEEAMAQLNSAGLGLPPNWNGNGWTLSGSNYTAPQRAMGSGYYKVAVVPGNTPVIYSTGYTTVAYSGVTPARLLRVTTTNQALFTFAVAAQKYVNLNGNNINIDSYDSSDPNASTNGKWDPAKAKDKGDVATNNGLQNSLQVGNANIKGKVLTGPTGNPAVGANGTVGSVAWVTGGNKGIQPGWWQNDLNMSLPNVVAPYTSGGAIMTGGLNLGITYTYILGTENYQAASINGGTMYVVGNAVLYVSGNANLGTITIAPNASLKIYVAGASTTMSAVNVGGDAKAFSYFGLPSNTSIKLSGNDTLVGTIYAPQADVTGSGGGNNAADISGSIVGSTLTLNGHFNIHWDAALGRTGISRGYVATSWTEL